MALITCPECNKQISDKAEQCIHCGYPIHEKKTILINGVETNVEHIYELLDKYKTKNIDRNKFCQETILAFLDLNLSSSSAGKLTRQIDQTLEIPKQINAQTKEEYLKEKSKPHCPKCNSTSITTGARGANGLFGFMGASKTVNRCGKCGHTWTPKR